MTNVGLDCILRSNLSLHHLQLHQKHTNRESGNDGNKANINAANTITILVHYYSLIIIIAINHNYGCSDSVKARTLPQGIPPGANRKALGKL